MNTLTHRESEVITAMLSGATTNKELASALGVAEATIRTHINNILAKCGAENRTKLVLMALGLVECVACGNVETRIG